MKSTLIMDEEIAAVCRPELASLDRRVTAEWVASQTLIHDTTSHPGGDFPSWADWLERAGLSDLPTDQGLKINSSASVIQAAMSGRGLALVRKRLVAGELENGRLVQLRPDIPWPVRWGYYAVASPRSLRRTEVRSFHDWLVQQDPSSSSTAAPGPSAA